MYLINNKNLYYRFLDIALYNFLRIHQRIFYHL